MLVSHLSFRRNTYKYYLLKRLKTKTAGLRLRERGKGSEGREGVRGTIPGQ